MKSFSYRCCEIDARLQDEAGWGRGAWVGINYAEPESEAERRALEILQERYPRAISVHVYNLVDFVADLVRQEMEDHSL